MDNTIKWNEELLRRHLELDRDELNLMCFDQLTLEVYKEKKIIELYIVGEHNDGCKLCFGQKKGWRGQGNGKVYLLKKCQTEFSKKIQHD